MVQPDIRIGQRKPHAQTEIFAVEMRSPHRIERFQPWKELLVDRRGMRAGQRLKKMIMGIDRPGMITCLPASNVES